MRRGACVGRPAPPSVGTACAALVCRPRCSIAGLPRSLGKCVAALRSAHSSRVSSFARARPTCRPGPFSGQTRSDRRHRAPVHRVTRGRPQRLGGKARAFALFGARLLRLWLAPSQHSCGARQSTSAPRPVHDLSVSPRTPLHARCWLTEAFDQLMPRRSRGRRRRRVRDPEIETRPPARRNRLAHAGVAGFARLRAAGDNGYASRAAELSI